ncbi:MAG: hypothetical protein JJT99_14280 [Rhodobacteraceae bacterium]|nr:hypothetical protein [Paracoccaceae bacterium]
MSAAETAYKLAQEKIAEASTSSTVSSHQTQIRPLSQIMAVLGWLVGLGIALF